MKANELRIGNYVFSAEDNKHGEVFQIDSSGIIFVNKNGNRWQDLKNIQPTPITEEILLKCKGVKSSYTSNPELIGASKKYDLGSIIIFQPNEDESVFYTCINEYMDNLIVDALHQLQNLYFALTGQELEINL